MKGDPELYAKVIFKWRTLGREFGVCPSTLKRWCKEAHVKLPQWNGNVKDAVWLPRKQLVILRQLFLESSVKRKYLLALRRFEKRSNVL